MEIFNRSGKWVGFFLLIIPAYIIMAQSGIIETNNVPSDLVGYGLVALFFAIVAIVMFSSSRMYINNDERAVIKICRYPWGEKIYTYSYEEIISVKIKVKTRRGNKGVSSKNYGVGIAQKAELFGMDGQSFIEMRSFPYNENGLNDAKEFSRKVCEYSDLNYDEDTIVKYT